VLDALAAAHVRGISHRDLRPDNIVLLDMPAVRDVVKVRDVVLAPRPDGSDELPFYLAPEAFAGSRDPAVDIYATGCILYELLTGTPPFVARARDHAPGATANAILARHLVEDAPRLPHDVPAELQPLLDAMLAKTPERRPTADHARDWLTALLDSAAAHEEPDQAATMLIPRQAIQPSFAVRARMLPRLATAAASRAFSALSIVPIVFALVVLAGSWWLYAHHGATPAVLLHAR
jgi:serine/threonine-protein kinase